VRNADANRTRHARIAGSYRRSAAAAIGAIAAALCAASARAGTPLLPPGAPPWGWLEEAAAAVYPASAPESLRAIRAASVIERGGRTVGRAETVAARSPRALREATEMDGVRQVVTLLGDEAWLEDANGVVRPASGDELVACRLAHALLFHDWAGGAVPGFRVHAAAEDGSLELRFDPEPGGPARSLRFARDAAGLLLPSRFERVEQGVPVSTTFDDWRVVGGVRFPFASRQETGDARFDVASRTTSLALLDSLPAGAIPRPAPRAPADARVVDPARAGSIPLERPGGLFLVRAEIGGEAGLGFVLDTGAGATVVATALVERLGLVSRGVVEARGAGGSEAAAYVEVPAMRLPGVELDGQTLVSLPLDGISAALGAPVDGILGWDFLSRFAVEIDVPARRLGLFPPGAYAPRPGAVRLPLRLEANVPRVDGTLEGRHAGSFLVDTGNATRLLLHTVFAARHGFLDQARESEVTLSGIGGHATMREVRVASLALGTVEFADVTAVLAPEGSGVVALEEAMGNVGAALFDGRVLALDYGAGALWLSGAASPAPASADSASAR
jgi:predicted aspartyl protease